MTIPLVYRIAFLLFDILLPAFGVYSNLATPADVLAMYTPRAPHAPVATETRFLLDSGAGWYAMLLFATAYLLAKNQKSSDMVAWTALQGGVLLTDAFMLFAFYREMAVNGRLATSSWSGQDWGNVAGYLVIAGVRGLFLCGVGLGDVEAARPKRGLD